MAEEKKVNPAFGLSDLAKQETLLQSAAANNVLKTSGIRLSGTTIPTSDGRQFNTDLAKKKDKKDKLTFGQSLSSDTAKGIYKGIGAAADIGSSFIERDVTKNPTGFDTQQKIGDALLSSGNPYAMLAGAAYKTLSGVAEQFGGNVNTITKDQANELGINGFQRGMNNVLGAIAPGLGWATNKTTEGQKSHLIDEMSNAYADTVSDIDRSDTLGGSKFLFGRNKIENSILTANRQNQLLTEMNLTNTQRKKSDYAQDLAQQNLNRYAGTNYLNTQVGRKGMKIQSLEEIREILKNRIVEELDIQKFAEGGSILPVGQRHKTLHHMDELGEQFEDLTRKGIPVVTVDESGDMVQVAEIECSEWTISKSLTDEIEALWKDGSEEAMIECGKLVCEHLLRQTKDDGGILNE